MTKQNQEHETNDLQKTIKMPHSKPKHQSRYLETIKSTRNKPSTAPTSTTNPQIHSPSSSQTTNTKKHQSRGLFPNPAIDKTNKNCYNCTNYILISKRIHMVAETKRSPDAQEAQEEIKQPEAPKNTVEKVETEPTLATKAKEVEIQHEKISPAQALRTAKENGLELSQEEARIYTSLTTTSGEKLEEYKSEHMRNQIEQAYPEAAIDHVYDALQPMIEAKINHIRSGESLDKEYWDTFQEVMQTEAAHAAEEAIEVAAERSLDLFNNAKNQKELDSAMTESEAMLNNAFAGKEDIPEDEAAKIDDMLQAFYKSSPLTIAKEIDLKQQQEKALSDAAELIKDAPDEEALSFVRKMAREQLEAAFSDMDDAKRAEFIDEQMELFNKKSSYVQSIEQAERDFLQSLAAPIESTETVAQTARESAPQKATTEQPDQKDWQAASATPESFAADEKRKIIIEAQINKMQAELVDIQADIKLETTGFSGFFKGIGRIFDSVEQAKLDEMQATSAEMEEKIARLEEEKLNRPAVTPAATPLPDDFYQRAVAIEDQLLKEREELVDTKAINPRQSLEFKQRRMEIDKQLLANHVQTMNYETEQNVQDIATTQSDQEQEELLESIKEGQEQAETKQQRETARAAEQTPERIHQKNINSVLERYQRELRLDTPSMETLLNGVSERSTLHDTRTQNYLTYAINNYAAIEADSALFGEMNRIAAAIETLDAVEKTISYEKTVKQTQLTVSELAEQLAVASELGKDSLDSRYEAVDQELQKIGKVINDTATKQAKLDRDRAVLLTSMNAFFHQLETIKRAGNAAEAIEETLAA